MALELINIGSAPNANDGDPARTWATKANSNFADLHYFTNVVEHGAVGDGTTDDSAAFQAAIDACETVGGGDVFVPEGTWVIEGLIIPTKVSLRGATGAILKHKGSSTVNAVIIESTALYASVRDITFDGNSPNISANVAPIKVQGSYNSVVGVDIYDAQYSAVVISVPADHITIDRVRVFVVNATDSSVHHGIWLEEDTADIVEEVLIRGCYISDTGLGGIGGRGDGVTVSNCMIKDTGTSGDGVSLYPAAVTGLSRRTVVIGNNIMGALNNGVHVGGDGDVTVFGNVILNSGNRGIFIESSTVEAKAVVSGNLVDTTTSLDGIRIEEFNNVTVNGNTVAAAGQHGIVVATSDAVVVSGNSVSSVTSQGINFTAVTRGLITGNMVVDSGVRGIVVGSTSDDVIISQNVVDNSATSQTRVQDTATNVFIYDNLLRGTAPYSNTTSGVVRVGRNEGDSAETVTAGASLTLPLGRPVVTVTGNTNITSISAAGQIGNMVTLIFTGTPTLTDGSNLKLAGNFVAAGTTNDADTCTLVCDGTNWYEVARSTN
jgi:parallel beta-helix repeat protein